MSRDFLLWLSVLAGPLIWLSSFEAKYALTHWACTFQTKVALFAVAILGMLLTAGSGLLASREWKALGAELPSEDGGPLSRSRSMAIAGIALSFGCFLIVVAQAIPDVVFGACE